MKSIINRLLPPALAMTAFACAPAASPDADTPSGGLRDIDIPADFTFQTSRAITAELTATGIETAVPVTIMTVSGDVLVRGAITPEAGFRTRFALPTKDQRVRLAFAEGRPEQQLVFAEVTDGRLVHGFAQ